MPGIAIAGLLSLGRYEALGRPTGFSGIAAFSDYSQGSDYISRPTPELAIGGPEHD